MCEMRIMKAITLLFLGDFILFINSVLCWKTYKY
jgi:hypothetical protein